MAEMIGKTNQITLNCDSESVNEKKRAIIFFCSFANIGLAITLTSYVGLL
jgi:hypothetical protein